MDGPFGCQADEAREVSVFKCFTCSGRRWAAEGGPSGEYDVSLETEGEDYVVPFAYKRTIVPGAKTGSH